MIKMPTKQEAECLERLKQDVENYFSGIKFRRSNGMLLRQGLVTLQKRIGIDKKYNETTEIGLNTLFRIWNYSRGGIHSLIQQFISYCTQYQV